MGSTETIGREALAFVDELKGMIAARRSFGGHPLWHEIADRDHSDIGDHIVVRFADTAAIRASARRAVAHSLDMWWQFFDGMRIAIAAAG